LTLLLGDGCGSSRQDAVPVFQVHHPDGDGGGLGRIEWIERIGVSQPAARSASERAERRLTERSGLTLPRAFYNFKDDPKGPVTLPVPGLLVQSVRDVRENKHAGSSLRITETRSGSPTRPARCCTAPVAASYRPGPLRCSTPGTVVTLAGTSREAASVPLSVTEDAWHYLRQPRVDDRRNRG
jgi:hypothetical protein